ncbi:MAG TPA: hypothetical protein PLB67_00600 [Candidatus Hydrogenedentes bacterium]|nr:hypothetical protein [Candidatus Hydrogenedentota bacterium]
MDKSQKVAVAVISAGILIGVAVIVVSGTGLPSFQQMPFRAAPGKQLESARPFVTETAQEAAVTAGPDAPVADMPDSLNPRPASDEPAPGAPAPSGELSPVDQALLEARHAFDPWTGVDRIEALLRSLENLGRASDLYTARAELYLRVDPPDFEGARQAVSRAVACASTAEQRDEARYAEIEVARRSGDVERARELAQALVSGDGPVSEGKLRAALLGAAMTRDGGDAAAAVSAYRKVMRLAVGAGDVARAEAGDVYRQAAWSLAQLLREADRRDEADAVAEEAARELARFLAAAGE